MRLENWQLKTWRLFLRVVRAVTLTVDDWVQAQEIALREPAYRREHRAEVAPAASSKREREFSGRRKAADAGFTPRLKNKFAAGVPGLGTAAASGARHSRRAGAPRLRYQHGQFVVEGRA